MIVPVLSLVLFVLFSLPANAGPIPQGDTQVSPLDQLNISLGIQYRVMYNNSNIPGPGGTDFDSTHPYDFFRQRLRLNIDMQPTDNAGGFVQLEYRGGWGGSSPDVSDPRDDTVSGGPTVNAFNRLQARGLRYGYLYATADDRTLAAGILPASDQVGDTLFSADWDFNVGGIAYVAKAGAVDYRLAYLRLVDTVNSDVSDDLTKDGNIYVGDLNFGLNGITVGAHVYYLGLGKVADTGALAVLQAGRTDEVWYGATVSGDFGPAGLNLFLIVNDGKIGGGEDHTGYAAKAEIGLPLGPARLSLLGIYTTGDEPGKVDERFVTPQFIVGTQGYWAYTHLFTANGPSDVNDLGVRIDNCDAAGDCLGLLTVQAKLSSRLMDRLGADLVAGLFQSVEDNAAGDNDMGTEVAGMLTYEMVKNLNLQLGIAGAFLGDFFDVAGEDADKLYEAFSRFQLQF